MSAEAPRLLADEMLGKLARELRALGYDIEYARDVDDDALLERAREAGRRLVTRDRQLADRAGPDAVLLESRQPARQLAALVDRLDLEPAAEAFLSRCLECNAELERARAPGRVPDDVEGDPHWRCPGCERVYWRGTHAADMLERLGGHLPDGFDREAALDPTAGNEERNP